MSNAYEHHYGDDQRGLKLIVLIIVVLGIVVGGAYATGTLQMPTSGVQDVGDWGAVSEQETEIVTTIWVDNPNILGINIGEDVTFSYELVLNDVYLAEGAKEGIQIESGNNSLEVTTAIENEKIAPWWVAFVQANETIPVRADPDVTIQTSVLTLSPDLPTQEMTILENSTPVITALSETASSMEGNYTKTITTSRPSDTSTQQLPSTPTETPLDGGSDGGHLETPTGDDGTGDSDDQSGDSTTNQEATIGYQIKRGWAEWGPVSEGRTTVEFHFILKNPSENIPVPAVPDGIGASADMNQVELLRAQGEAFTPKNVGAESLIGPGQSQEVILAVTMDNEKIDEWFRRFVKKDERTSITVQLQMVFEVRGETIRVPEEGGVTYGCQLQTGIFVDNQETQTNCGSVDRVAP